jgi:hypothetical protein
MIAKRRPLDIFSVLRRLDVGDKTVYQATADADAKKELESFVGFPALRWMSAVEGPRVEQEYCLEATNEIVNPGYFKLGQHRELQCKLLAASGARKKMRHCWIGGPKKKKGALCRQPVQQVWPHLSDDEADFWIELNGPQAVIEMARSCGWDDEMMKKLKGDVDDGS